MFVQNKFQIAAPLSEHELGELDSFLMSDATSDETMMMDCLDGYLTAIAVGPVMSKPSEWLPGVWGPTVNDEPKFQTMAQAQHIFDLIMKQLNGIIWNLHDEQEIFKPVFDSDIYPDNPREYITAAMWARGFVCGINLNRKSWQVFFDDPNCVAMLRPIHLLGSDDVTPEEIALTQTPEQREAWSVQILDSIDWIYKFWSPYRHAIAERTVATSMQREHSKVGRNDTCTCGSGKKFKKCCGASTVLH